MPKFVSGSSGHIYAPDKLPQTEKDEVEKVVEQIANQQLEGKSSGTPGTQATNESRKPSSINKKGTKEKQKNSLDLFKEELRRLAEERDEQRNKLKQKADEISSSNESISNEQKKSLFKPVPVPLKPDPRCPTTLTLQVPKDKDSSLTGSFDTGDPTTTNIYVGNVNPTVTENDLCDIFGKFGPLASIKIMWPRTDEERIRNRNSGFVAFMSRVDSERALRALNGLDVRGYEMKLGWGKAVPIPQNPVYIPPDLLELLKPPPQSGLPFNGQLHDDDVGRGYKVPDPLPQPAANEINSDPRTIETYQEFLDVLSRSTVRVVIPQNRSLLDLIHRTIEFVIREGPVFESIISAQESKNSAYSFLHDYQSNEHVYYRWKLYSILHGEDPYEWRTADFRMYEGGPIWRPPPLNPFADGMPLELIEKTTGLSKGLLLTAVDGSNANDTKLIHSKIKPLFTEGLRLDTNLKDSRIKGSLGEAKRDLLGNLLRNLEPTKSKVGAAMMFCIDHADAAQEIIDCIHESLLLLETPFQKKLSRLFLVSDILHNCSAAVTNASFFRKGFQAKLTPMFEHLREYLINIEDRQKADKFKQKALRVLSAWKEWTLYEDDYLIQLSNILLGIKNSQQPTIATDHKHDEVDEAQQSVPTQVSNQQAQQISIEENLDGEPIDEKLLNKCLERKGLSLRWYYSLELSDDEEDDQTGRAKDSATVESPASSSNRANSAAKDNPGDEVQAIKFKASKWETVDPNEVADQVVTLSKWDSIDEKRTHRRIRSPVGSEQSGSSTSFSSDDDVDGEKRVSAPEPRREAKKIKRCGGSSSSSDGAAR